MSVELPDPLRRIMRRRQRLEERALEAYDSQIQALAENIARRLAGVLGTDPDQIYEPAGDDGRRVGGTDFENRLGDIFEAIDGDLTQAESLRAAALASSLEEIEDFIEAAGLDKIRGTLRTSVSDLAGLAEQTMIVQGVGDADGALDTIAAEAMIGDLMDRMDEAIGDKMGREIALKIREGLSANLGFTPLDVLIEGLANSIPSRNARTEASTSIAMADRFVQDIVRKTIDPTGERYLMAYVGAPIDGVIRPFCRELVGYAFTEADFNLANNRQLSHPRLSGGGYNCRHMVIPVPQDEIESMGLTLGTLEQIEAANRAAAEAKKPKRRKRARR